MSQPIHAYACPGRAGSLVYLAKLAVPVFCKKTVGGPGYLDGADFPEAREAARQLERIDVRRARLGNEIERLELGEKFHLSVVPTMDCGMDCAYCYARDARRAGKAGKLDLGVLRDFLALAEDQVGGVTVYGGEPFLYPRLAAAIREKFSHYVTFATGLGFGEKLLTRALEDTLRYRVGLSMSIDPPAAPGKPYSRVYPPFGGRQGADWYLELLDRAGRVARNKTKFGVRATLSAGCLDFRQLRADLAKATGVPYRKLPMKLEPAAGTYDADAAQQLEALLELDAQEVAAGDLNLSASPFKSVLEVLDPDVNFSRGGCFSLRNIAVSSSAKLSFCSRSASWPGGLFEFCTPDEYLEVVSQAMARQNCRGCLQEFACGTHCHAAMVDDRQDSLACQFQVKRAELALQVAAKFPGIENINRLLPRRAGNLQRWATPNLGALAEHARALSSWTRVMADNLLVRQRALGLQTSFQGAPRA